MKSIHITFFNVFIVLVTHIIAFVFLNKYAIQQGACGMGVAIIAGSIPLIINFLWSSIIIYFVSKSGKKQYFDDTLLYVIIAIIGNSLIAYFSGNYLWRLLILPYLLFLGESFYLKSFFVERKP